jgi:hypothetical protein
MTGGGVKVGIDAELELRRQLLAVVQAVYGEEVVAGLHETRTLRQLYLAREELAVGWARAQGIGWRSIANALGTTRHALCSRYQNDVRHLGAAVVNTGDIAAWMPTRPA